MATTYTAHLQLPMQAATDPASIALLNEVARKTDSGVVKAWQGKAAYNCLINSDFLHMINSRGQTAYTGSVYSADGWRAYHADTTHQITAAGFAISGGTPNVYQQLDPDEFDATKPCTAAICDAEGNVYVWSGIPTEVAYSPVCVYLINSKPVFRAIGEKTWQWAAVYQGEYTAETLPGYVQKGRAVEQTACQRRVVSLGGIFRYRAVQRAGSLLDFSIPLPATMRGRPSFNTAALTVYSMPSMATQTGFTFAIVAETVNGVVIRATKTDHGLTDATLGIAANTIFSAEEV